MSTQLVRHVALVSESDLVKLGDVTLVAAALQKQMVRDLSTAWDIVATVAAFPRLEDVPLDYWPMVVRDDIGVAAPGVHRDRNGQPYALISSRAPLDEWALIASHECLEMLVDPFGDRLVAGDSPDPNQGRVNFLIEICDPSGDPSFGYTVNGVLMSDFYTPQYFDPVTAGSVRYSFTGALTAPREVLPGGYLTWHEPVSDEWWQKTWFDGDEPTIASLGPLDLVNGSFREQVDRITAAAATRLHVWGREAAARAGLSAAVVAAATTSRAAALRKDIEAACKPRREGRAPSRRRPGRRR